MVISENKSQASKLRSHSRESELMEDMNGVCRTGALWRKDNGNNWANQQKQAHHYFLTGQCGADMGGGDLKQQGHNYSFETGKSIEIDECLEGETSLQLPSSFYVGET